MQSLLFPFLRNLYARTRTFRPPAYTIDNYSIDTKDTLAEEQTKISSNVSQKVILIINYVLKCHSLGTKSISLS